MKNGARPILKWIFISLGIGCVAFLIYYFFMLFQYASIPGKATKEITQLECNGTISNIKFTETYLSTITIRQVKDSVEFVFPKCQDSATFFGFIEIGNKMKKEKGSLKVSITKQKTGETKEFEYPM